MVWKIRRFYIVACGPYQYTNHEIISSTFQLHYTKDQE